VLLLREDFDGFVVLYGVGVGGINFFLDYGIASINDSVILELES